MRVLLAAAALALACGSESAAGGRCRENRLPGLPRGTGPDAGGVRHAVGERRGRGRFSCALPASGSRIGRGGSSSCARRGAARPSAGCSLGPSGAALHYHLASRDPVLPRGALQPNRLVVLEAGDEARLGLLIEPGARDPDARFASVAELSPEAGARIVALAQALGAWAVVANDRYPLAADGHPFLPFFVPQAGGDWRALAGRSLDAFLPPALGRHFVQTPGFRRLQYRHLADFSLRLPALAAAAERFAASPQAPDLGDEIAELRALLSESFEAYQGYLDSAWIEMAVRVRPPDAARVRIHVHSVSEVTLDALFVEMPRKLLVVDSEALSALRLSAGRRADSRPARAGSAGVPPRRHRRAASPGAVRLRGRAARFRARGSRAAGSELLAPARPPSPAGDEPDHRGDRPGRPRQEHREPRGSALRIGTRGRRRRLPRLARARPRSHRRGRGPAAPGRGSEAPARSCCGKAPTW